MRVSPEVVKGEERKRKLGLQQNIISIAIKEENQQEDTLLMSPLSNLENTPVRQPSRHQQLDHNSNRWQPMLKL
jgi:hypothetical protein